MKPAYEGILHLLEPADSGWVYKPDGLLRQQVLPNDIFCEMMFFCP
jgi:hypothetical protein